MSNGLYTPEVQKAVRRAAWNAGGRFDGEELFSVAQCAVAENMPKYDASRFPSFTAWAVTVGKRAIVDYKRKFGINPRRASKAGRIDRSEVFLDGLPSHVQESVMLDRIIGEEAPKEVPLTNLAIIWGALAATKPVCFRVLNDYYFNGLLYREIATAMGLTESRICQLASEGKRWLRQHIKRGDFGGATITTANV